MSRDAESRSRQRDAEASEREEKSKLQFQMERDALREKLRTTELQNDALKEVIAAQESLLVAHRLGDHRRADSALTRLEKAKAKVKSNEKTVCPTCDGKHPEFCSACMGTGTED